MNLFDGPGKGIKKHILVIAYYAPPSNSSGTFRTLGFIRHLVNMGWQVTLLTGKNSNVDLKENELKQNIPPSVRVIRAANWDLFFLWQKLKREKKKDLLDGKDKKGKNRCAPVAKRSWLWTSKELFTNFLKTPDQQIGWCLPALWKCIFSAQKPAIIYSSAPPFTGHLIGMLCKFIWRVPLVCDFRDPWIDNPFRQEKLPLVDKWDRWLENLTFTKADLVIANTERMASVFKLKNRVMNPQVEVIPNGYDVEDFSGIEPIRTYPDNQLLLIHAGVLYGERNPLNFLKAVQFLARTDACPNLKVLLVGSSEPIDGIILEDLIVDMGLSSYIQTHPPVSHAIALSLMKGADALLLLALGTTLQVPAKLYEYFGLEKPILSISEPESATGDITALLQGVVYNAHNETSQIKAALCTLHDDWQKGHLLHQGVNSEVSALLSSMRRERQVKVLTKHFFNLLAPKYKI